MILYLQDLQAVTTSQRAEIQLLEEKLKASEWDNKQLRRQAQNDMSAREKDRKKSTKLTTMLRGAMLMLGMTEDKLTQLVQRLSTDASNANAEATELRKANADLRDSIKEKDVTITELKETKVNDNDTIAHVRRLLEQACDRIKEMVNTKTDLRDQTDNLTDAKKAPRRNHLRK